MPIEKIIDKPVNGMSYRKKLNLSSSAPEYYEEDDDRVLKFGNTHVHLPNEDVKKEAASGPAPILDINSPLMSPDKARAVKCRCNKSWCPNCSKDTVIKPLVERIKDWDYNRVRQVVLTLDRRQFESAEIAFDYIASHKKIPNLFRNLERTLEITIVDWVRVIEWHKDGYPHWHIFVQVEKSGRAGQIGGDKLRRYWPFGAVRESYIHSESHWKAFVGYFQKHGYFEHKKGKKHQVELPEWAKKRKGVIRRVGSKSLKKMTEKEKAMAKIKRDREFFEEHAAAFEDGCGLVAGIIEPEPEEPEEEPEKLSQGERLEQCGASIDVYDSFSFSPLSFLGNLKVSYKEFLKAVPGEFVKGFGYVFDKNYLNQFEVG